MAKNIYRYGGLLLALLGNGVWADEAVSASSASQVAASLATVNGVAITAQDVQFATGPGRMAHGHDASAGSGSKATTLESVIQQEILAQQAVALGLDKDPTYREWVERLEVQLRAFQRKRLADLLLEREVANQSKVSDDEAKVWFDRHAEEVASEIQVLQMLRRDEATLVQALEDIKQGVPFAEVAARGLPELPPDAQKPWDLGYLRWEQIPPFWWEALASLKPGETSGIIRGPGQRYWIIQLLDRRERSGAGYEEMKSKIVERLQAERAQQLQKELPVALRAKAQVVYPTTPAVSQ